MLYLEIMGKKIITAERLMYFFGSIVLIIATIMNLNTRIAFRSIIPYTKYVEACINGTCAILCMILVYKPNLRKLAYILFAVEATCTTLIGFAGIGTMLLMFLVLSLFTDGFFKTNLKIKVPILITWWSLVIIGVYPPFKLRGSLFALALTLFYIAIMFATYDRLKDRLSYLLPNPEETTEVKLPSRGSVLSLSQYGLSKRQIKFLMLCIDKDLTYEEIAEQNFISVSVVKKEMSACCKAFGVRNKENLKLLLLQYIIKN